MYHINLGRFVPVLPQVRWRLHLLSVPVSPESVGVQRRSPRQGATSAMLLETNIIYQEKLSPSILYRYRRAVEAVFRVKCILYNFPPACPRRPRDCRGASAGPPPPPATPPGRPAVTLAFIWVKLLKLSSKIYIMHIYRVSHKSVSTLFIANKHKHQISSQMKT